MIASQVVSNDYLDIKICFPCSKEFPDVFEYLNDIWICNISDEDLRIQIPRFMKNIEKVLNGHITTKGYDVEIKSDSSSSKVIELWPEAVKVVYPFLRIQGKKEDILMLMDDSIKNSHCQLTDKIDENLNYMASQEGSKRSFLKDMHILGIYRRPLFMLSRPRFTMG